MIVAKHLYTDVLVWTPWEKTTHIGFTSDCAVWSRDV
jgi:hypothetical protein